MNSVRYAFLGVIPALLFGVVSVSASPIHKFGSECRIKYNVVSKVIGNPAMKFRATFEVINTDSALLYRFRLQDDTGFSMVAVGGRFCVSTKENVNIVSDSLQFESLPIKVYFPFNFQACPVLVPVESVPELNTRQAKEVFRQEGVSWNVGVAITYRTQPPVIAGGELTEQQTPSGRVTTLVMGRPFGGKIVWSDYRTCGKDEVPGRMELTVDKGSLVNGKPVYTPEFLYVFTLQSISSSVSEKDRPTLLSVLRDGMFVSYEGQDGSASVAYQASKGTFEQQLAEQLEVVKSKDGKVLVTSGGPLSSADTVTSPGPFPWVPLFLTIGFGAISIIIVLKSIWDRKAK